MAKSILRCACLLALVFSPWLVHAERDGAWQDAWFAYLNQERDRAGTPRLRPCPVLDQVAEELAEEMAAQGWRMKSPSAKVVSNRLRQVGYSAHDWRQELLVPPGTRFVTARGRPSVALDGRFRDLGIGSADIPDGGTIHVFLFGWHKGDHFAGATARLEDRARIAAEMLSQVNDVRRRYGLAPLTRNPLLDHISQEHAEDMLARSYFGHRSPEGLGPSERARADGYRSGIGENIVEQRYSPQDALAAWLESPPHRRILLDPQCTELGLGLAVGAGYDAAPGGYRVIWVQSLGRGSRAEDRASSKEDIRRAPSASSSSYLSEKK